MGQYGVCPRRGWRKLIILDHGRSQVVAAAARPDPGHREVTVSPTTNPCTHTMDLACALGGVSKSGQAAQAVGSCGASRGMFPGRSSVEEQQQLNTAPETCDT